MSLETQQPLGIFSCRLCGDDHPHQHDHKEEHVLRLGLRPINELTDDDIRSLFGMLIHHIRASRSVEPVKK